MTRARRSGSRGAIFLATFATYFRMCLRVLGSIRGSWEVPVDVLSTLDRILHTGAVGFVIDRLLQCVQGTAEDLLELHTALGHGPDEHAVMLGEVQCKAPVGWSPLLSGASRRAFFHWATNSSSLMRLRITFRLIGGWSM